MKYLIGFLFMACIGSILAGYFINVSYSQKLIGFGVIGIFVVVFPLFSYHSWKGKNVQDYMLTKENLDKMRDHEEK